MFKIRNDLGLNHIEKGIRDSKKLEARINRDKLDPSDCYVYIAGPILYNRDRESGKEAIVSLYAYDIIALEELWDEVDGLLTPNEDATLSRDMWGTNTELKVRPYLEIRSSYSEQQEILEKAVKGNFEIEYSDNLNDRIIAKVFSNSLFDADGIGNVRLSEELRPDFKKEVSRIKCFYDLLKNKE